MGEYLEIAWYEDGKEKVFVRVSGETLKNIFRNVDTRKVMDVLERVEQLKHGMEAKEEVEE